jgi:hypothetical protein
MIRSSLVVAGFGVVLSSSASDLFSDVSYPQYHLRQRRASKARLALADLPHHRVHIRVVPDLCEFAVFEAIKGKLRSSYPTTGRLNSLEGPPGGYR